MMRRLIPLFCLLLLTLLPMMASQAQDAPPALPASHSLVGVSHIPQQWNNCGPATLTMGLSYFGIPADQGPAASWLKPTSEDGNVSPWQLVAYVNEELSTNIRAAKRVCGDLTMLKTLLANDFPVVVEMGSISPAATGHWSTRAAAMARRPVPVPTSSTRCGRRRFTRSLKCSRQPRVVP